MHVVLQCQEFSPSGEAGSPVTVGAYARDIFLDQVCCLPLS